MKVATTSRARARGLGRGRFMPVMAVMALSGMGCQSAGSATPGPAASTAPSAEPPAGQAAASASANGSFATVGTARPASTHWSGTYTSARGAFHVPDGGEWEKYDWRGGDGGEGLGDGPMALAVDGATRAVTGTAGGPIGDVVLVGTETDGALTASVRRKDPTDHGLTGTLLATRGTREVTGTMRLSLGDAHLIREATFHLTPSPAP